MCRTLFPKNVNLNIKMKTLSYSEWGSPTPFSFWISLTVLISHCTYSFTNDIIMIILDFSLFKVRRTFTQWSSSTRPCLNNGCHTPSQPCINSWRKLDEDDDPWWGRWESVDKLRWIQIWFPMIPHRRENDVIYWKQQVILKVSLNTKAFKSIHCRTPSLPLEKSPSQADSLLKFTPHVVKCH